MIVPHELFTYSTSNITIYQVLYVNSSSYDKNWGWLAIVLLESHCWNYYLLRNTVDSMVCDKKVPVPHKSQQTPRWRRLWLVLEIWECTAWTVTTIISFINRIYIFQTNTDVLRTLPTQGHLLRTTMYLLYCIIKLRVKYLNQGCIST